MSYNYNTRQSGRYNTPGRFVRAGQSSQYSGAGNIVTSHLLSEPNYAQRPVVEANSANCRQLPVGSQAKTFNIEQEQQQSMQFNNVIGQPPQPPQSYNNGEYIEVPKQEEQFQEPVEMNTAASNDQTMDTSSEDQASQRPHWMKPKLQGVRKISTKERRRRQNESLRRLLTPKNALMVLNEIEKGDNNFTVEPVSVPGQFFKHNATSSFCAALELGGNSYKGYGENKMAARNAAAEQAVRDLLLKRMNTLLNTDKQAEGEEDLPMIQLASFALHKLFAEWECQGHRVPQLRPTPQVSDSASDAGSGAGAGGAGAGAGAGKPRALRTELPAAAAAMHPCMLLSHMRPGLTYREAAVEGDKQPNIAFTMEVEVDGKVYSGKACNKREARKAAAREACQDIFGLRFDDDPQ